MNSENKSPVPVIYCTVFLVSVFSISFLGIVINTIYCWLLKKIFNKNRTSGCYRMILTASITNLISCFTAWIYCLLRLISGVKIMTPPFCKAFESIQSGSSITSRLCLAWFVIAQFISVKEYVFSSFRFLRISYTLTALISCGIFLNDLFIDFEPDFMEAFCKPKGVWITPSQHLTKILILHATFIVIFTLGLYIIWYRTKVGTYDPEYTPKTFIGYLVILGVINFLSYFILLFGRSHWNNKKFKGHPPMSYTTTLKITEELCQLSYPFIIYLFYLPLRDRIHRQDNSSDFELSTIDTLVQ